MILRNIILIAGGLFLLSSCQDIIDIPAPEGENRLVVEAFLDNLAQEQVVRITQTLPYFTNEFTPGITDAEVTVTSSSGNTFIFEDQGDGDYIYDASNGPIGAVGEIFTLDVNTQGKNISAIAAMNRVPVIDSISQEFRDDAFGEGIFCNFFSRDPIGLGDTYYIKTFKNGEFLNEPLELNIAFDAGFSAGSEVDGFIFITPIRETMNPQVDTLGTSPWDPGDVARVEIHSTNVETFFFLESIRDQLLNSLNTIFAEPIVNSKGNIVNNTDDEEILGIFNVAAISSLEIEIQ
jgi:hypothetical protein